MVDAETGERLEALSPNGTTVDVRVTEEPGPHAPVLWPSIGEYPCYDTALYGTLTNDTLRNERFRNALRRLAPGRAVLDLGTGQDVLWAREAHAAGARAIVAVEGMPESHRRAAETLAALSLTERITLLRGYSTELTVEPRADVCVAEVIGSLAGAEGAAAILADARHRLLAPGGLVVPYRCRTLAAGVEFAEVLDGNVAFAPSSLPYLNTIFEGNGRPFDVRLRVRNPSPSAVLTSRAAIETLDFNGDLRVEQETTVSLTVERPGHIDGLLTWLEIACLPDEVPLDALRDKTSWASVYLPLYDEPVAVVAGDRLHVTARVSLSEDRVHPNYHVAATVVASGHSYDGEHRSVHHGDGFRRHQVYRHLFPGRPGDVTPTDPS